MYKMLQTEEPQDYMIASGKSHSLREFVDAAFDHGGLDPEGRLEVNSGLMRPTDLSYSAMDPNKIRRSLQWMSGQSMKEIAGRMHDDILF
jgi:GDPmannose 4,6-dehydratase